MEDKARYPEAQGKGHGQSLKDGKGNKPNSLERQANPELKVEVSEEPPNLATGRVSHQAMECPLTAKTVTAMGTQLKLPKTGCAKHLSREGN